MRTWTERETPGLADAAKSVKYMQNTRLQTSFHMRRLTVFCAQATTDMGLLLAAKCTPTGFVVSSIRGRAHLSVLFALSPSRLDVLQYPACALSLCLPGQLAMRAGGGRPQDSEWDMATLHPDQAR